MDKAQLQTDIEKVIDLLPAEIPLTLAMMVPKYWKEIAEKVPELKDLIAPHVKAGAFEASIGTLDMADVMGAIEAALQLKLPQLAAAMQAADDNNGRDVVPES
jgi:hypothetical protein